MFPLHLILLAPSPLLCIMARSRTMTTSATNTLQRIWFQVNKCRYSYRMTLTATSQLNGFCASTTAKKYSFYLLTLS